VLQNIALEFTFNTTLEPHEEGKGRGLSLVPCVRLTKKVRSDEDGKITTYDEPVEMIFNGVKRKYAAEQFTKLGFLGKLTKNDYHQIYNYLMNIRKKTLPLLISKEITAVRRILRNYTSYVNPSSR